VTVARHHLADMVGHALHLGGTDFGRGAGDVDQHRPIVPFAAARVAKNSSRSGNVTSPDTVATSRTDERC